MGHGRKQKPHLSLFVAVVPAPQQGKKYEKSREKNKIIVLREFSPPPINRPRRADVRRVAWRAVTA